MVQRICCVLGLLSSCQIILDCFTFWNLIFKYFLFLLLFYFFQIWGILILVVYIKVFNCDISICTNNVLWSYLPHYFSYILPTLPFLFSLHYPSSVPFNFMIFFLFAVSSQKSRESTCPLNKLYSLWVSIGRGLVGTAGLWVLLQFLVIHSCPIWCSQPCLCNVSQDSQY
jgi:hypothetical protein